MRPEFPATGKCGEGFPWFSLFLEQMLSSYTNFTLHHMLLIQPFKNFRQKSNTPNLSKFCYNTTLQNANSDFRQIAQFLSSALYSNSPHSFALLLHFTTLYVNYNLPLRKEERTQPGNRQSRKFFVPPPNKCRVFHFTSSSSSSSSKN